MQRFGAEADDDEQRGGDERPEGALAVGARLAGAYRENRADDRREQTQRERPGGNALRENRRVEGERRDAQDSQRDDADCGGDERVAAPSARCGVLASAAARTCPRKGAENGTQSIPSPSAAANAASTHAQRSAGWSSPRARRSRAKAPACASADRWSGAKRSYRQTGRSKKKPNEMGVMRRRRIGVVVSGTIVVRIPAGRHAARARRRAGRSEVGRIARNAGPERSRAGLSDRLGAARGGRRRARGRWRGFSDGTAARRRRRRAADPTWR